MFDSPKAPLYNLTGQNDRVLAVDWSMYQYMISGGCDNAIKIFKHNDTSRSVAPSAGVEDSGVMEADWSSRAAVYTAVIHVW